VEWLLIAAPKIMAKTNAGSSEGIGNNGDLTVSEDLEIELEALTSFLSPSEIEVSQSKIIRDLAQSINRMKVLTKKLLRASKKQTCMLCLSQTRKRFSHVNSLFPRLCT
jgi:hypothetical protein